MASAPSLCIRPRMTSARRSSGSRTDVACNSCAPMKPPVRITHRRHLQRMALLRPRPALSRHRRLRRCERHHLRHHRHPRRRSRQQAGWYTSPFRQRPRRRHRPRHRACQRGVPMARATPALLRAVVAACGCLRRSQCCLRGLFTHSGASTCMPSFALTACQCRWIGGFECSQLLNPRQLSRGGRCQKRRCGSLRRRRCCRGRAACHLSW